MNTAGINPAQELAKLVQSFFLLHQVYNRLQNEAKRASDLGLPVPDELESLIVKTADNRSDSGKYIVELICIVLQMLKKNQIENAEMSSPCLMCTHKNSLKDGRCLKEHLLTAEAIKERGADGCLDFEKSEVSEKIFHEKLEEIKNSWSPKEMSDAIRYFGNFIIGIAPDVENIDIQIAEPEREPHVQAPIPGEKSPEDLLRENLNPEGATGEEADPA